MIGDPLSGPVIARVADRAGVSQRIVGMVLTGRSSVAPGTRNRVISAIAEVGCPDHAEQGDAPGVLGVLMPGHSLYDHTPTGRAVEDAARDAGLSTVAGSLDDPAAVERLLSRSPAGLICVAPAGEVPSAIARSRVPVVAVDPETPWLRARVTVDDQAGARLATRHLLAAGHRTVWHVAGPRECAVSRRREQGWRDALHEAGVEAPPVIRADWTAAAGYAAGRVLAAARECRAVFAAGDQIALGLLHAMAEADRPVPGDVSVVGFGDAPESAFLNPPLSTVRVDLAEVGAAAVRLVHEQRRLGLAPQEPLVITPVLVERRTVAAPSARDDRPRAARRRATPSSRRAAAV
jgi:DNA-binding LacI/PurR family transcriptional regulator